MKKVKGIVACLLVLSLASSLMACNQKTGDVNVRSKGKKTEETEETEKTKETTEATTTETSETTAEPTPPEPTSTPNLGFNAPEEGCKIEFPTRDVYHYNMTLKLDPTDNTVSGNIVFDFYNDSEDTWEKLCMRDYSSLFEDESMYGKDIKGALTVIENIDDSRTGELSYERDSSDVSVIWIDLDEALEPGEWMTLSYDFTAAVPEIDDRYGVWNGIYNITNFYPILAEYVDGDWSHLAFYDEGECFYSEISKYDVTIQVPEDYIVVTSGEEVSSESVADGIVYEYEADYVRDFVFCASNVFEIESRECEGINVNVLYNKENPPTSDMSKSVEKTFYTCDNSFKAFNEAFGTYPYGELDVVLAPIAAGGMEYPNLIIINDAYCSGFYTQNDYEVLETCVAHEIGHQWFMGIVGSNSGGEPWLDESVTSYTELVYCEYVGGSIADNNLPISSKDLLDLSDPEQAAQYSVCFPLDRPHDEFEGYAYVYGVYQVGKDMLYQMDECLGTDEFHAVLREYVHRYAFTNATTHDFLEVLYEYAGYDNETLNNLVANCLQTEI